MRTAPTETVPHIHKGGMTMMDTQTNYSDDMMRLRRDAMLSLKEFGFGKDIYEFCTDWILNHDTTAGIKEAFREYETQRPDQTIKVST